MAELTFFMMKNAILVRSLRQKRTWAYICDAHCTLFCEIIIDLGANCSCIVSKFFEMINFKRLTESLVNN